MISLLLTLLAGENSPTNTQCLKDTTIINEINAA